MLAQADRLWHQMVDIFWAWSHLVWGYWSALTLMAMVELCGGAIGKVSALGWFGLTVVVPCLQLFVLVYPIAHLFTGASNCISGTRTSIGFENNHPCLIQWLIMTTATTLASVMWLATATSVSQVDAPVCPTELQCVQEYLSAIEASNRYDIDASQKIPIVIQLRWALNNVFVVLAWFAISLSNLLIQAYSHSKHQVSYAAADTND